jgi:hypothetical protein
VDLGHGRLQDAWIMQIGILRLYRADPGRAQAGAEMRTRGGVGAARVAHT